MPDQEDLNELFDQLRVSALGTVFAWVTKVQTPRLRVLLENAAARLAMANTAELVRLITSTDRDVAREAVRRAGAVRATAAVGALAKLTTDPRRRRCGSRAVAGVSRNRVTRRASVSRAHDRG